MAGLKFSSFGAATMPLSKIVVDKDLDMGSYSIKTSDIDIYSDLDVTPYNVRTNIIIAENAKTPISPDTWATETLSWPDDVSPEEIYSGWVTISTTNIATLYTNTNSRAVNTQFYAGVPPTGYTTVYIMFNGEIVASGHINHNTNTSWTSSYLWVPPGTVVTAKCSSTNDYSLYLKATTNGELGAPYLFNLDNKWLAPDTWMDTFTTLANLKIKYSTTGIYQLPLSLTNYLTTFPLKPFAIDFHSDWPVNTTRPVIRVYTQ